MTIDLRSDTVTRPTSAMRAAMASAEVGDDVYGEDPTVNQLQRLAADLLGKQDALFVPSGTMGNLISVLIHTPRGHEVILGDQSHIFHFEQGGASAVGSCVFHPIPTQPDGTLDPRDIRSAIRNPDNVHNAAPGVICLENTHNRCGGAILSPDYCNQIRALADDVKLPLHLDGARLAHASVALGIPLHELTKPFHSVQFDLSKGLGAPVGGIIAGSRDFITQAKRYRKLLGGGMRQAGILAAAGIVALEQNIGRLADDHAQAQRLAQALSQHPSLDIDPKTVQTNILIIRTKPPLTPQSLLAHLRDHHILANPTAPDRIRLVTHYDVSPADIDTVIAAINRLPVSRQD